MYTPKERDSYFQSMIDMLNILPVVEGVVQLGSGVTGYKDEFSDIDLMVATSTEDDVIGAKDYIKQYYKEWNPVIIKEKQFSKNIYLLIVILENSLEFNISIHSMSSLNVRSPLWKVVLDKTGFVSEKMKEENLSFSNKPIKYATFEDPVFEFVYGYVRFDKELKRNNLVYALKMLELMRDYTLIVQALNEDKKLHQFKAYDTLNSNFLEQYLSTYPQELSVNHLVESASLLKKLFIHTVMQSSTYTLDDSLGELLKTKNAV
ncbi:aminoglycoside 6-adenylyltransferase [Fictibacillus nanhaiensis]|uniref:Aminoglycoside 6-adenylyltransferase n=1 Tax=Fictibacillus nanhaiensis TaxID=742169 RepID=A0ABS2ZVU0_9BACL|nr:aminoglycoside 6-adenylyltransferase [Fictibacillus nanhaiensis]